MGLDLARAFEALDRATPIKSLERGRLRPVEVAAQSIAAAAPTAGLVTTPSLLQATGAGPVLAVLLATGLVMLVASSINRFTRRLAAPGSLYTFAVRGLGPLTGLIVAGALATGYLFISLASVVGAAYYLSRSLALVPPLASVAHGIPPVLALAVGVLVCALVLMGVRRATVVMLLIEILAIGTLVAALGFAAVAGVTRLPSSASFAVQDLVTTPSPLALGTGVVIAFAAFIGFESSSALGPEAHRPLRSVPRVITWTAVGIGVLMTFGTIVQAMAFDQLGLRRSANPVDDILVALHLSGFLPALDVAVMGSFIACATASLMALVRLMMALAIDGVLPATLGDPHPRWRTPHRAALVLVPITCGVPGLLLVAVPVREAMDQLIQISVLGYLVAYLFVCLSVLRFLPAIGERTVSAMVVAGAASLGLFAALVIYVGVTISTGTVGPALVLAVSSGVACAWWLWAKKRDPGRLQDLGSYDHPSTSAVWWGRSLSLPALPPDGGSLS